MHHRQEQPGFSLIELLIVISIIVLIIALAFPLIGAMTKDVDQSAAVNAITVSLDVSRTVVNRRRDTLFQNPLSTDWALNYPGGSGKFSGVAAVFTPANEIRIVENNQIALSIEGPTSAKWPMERYRPSPPFPPIGTVNIDLNGYRDVPGIEYVQLPRTIGVVGIYREGSDPVGDFDLLPPPFAIRFNENGQLTPSDTRNTDNNLVRDVVYYDGNYDGSHQTDGAGRLRDDPHNPGSTPYDPREWDPTQPEYLGDSDVFVEEDASGNPVNLHKLPFEMLEAVVGVVVYNKNDLHNAMRIPSGQPGHVPPWTDDTDLDDEKRLIWLSENGRWLLVSRYTGNVIRERNNPQP